MTELGEWFRDEAQGRVRRVDGCEVVFEAKFIGHGRWTAMVPVDAQYTAWQLLFAHNQPQGFALPGEAALAVEDHLRRIGRDNSTINATP
jgi:hypothetical protein